MEKAAVVIPSLFYFLDEINLEKMSEFNYHSIVLSAVKAEK